MKKGTDPFVGTEANPDADLVVEAGVPVDADDHVDDELENAEDVRIVGARVGAVEELEHPTDSQQTVDAHERKVDAEMQVEQVDRKVCSSTGERWQYR